MLSARGAKPRHPGQTVTGETMSTPMQEEPVLGALYKDTDGLTFEVTGLDEDDGTIAIRYDDGSVDQIDIDTWYELELRRLKADGEWQGGDEEDDDEVKLPGRAADDEDDDGSDEEDDGDE